LKLELEEIEWSRFEALRKKLDQAESRLRSLQGAIQSRANLPEVDTTAAEQGNLELESQLFRLLGLDVSAQSPAQQREMEDRLRQQALAYFQKSRVDPQLWKDLASS